MHRIFLTLCLLLASTLVRAAPTDPTAADRAIYLADMTWTEVRDAIAAGRTTVIVPVGGTEQSGPNIALGKHNVRVHLLAGRIARTLGNALVAPVIAYVPEGGIDPPTGHMRFPGTISISDAAFRGVLEGAARSLRRAGFRDIVLIGDHGGYQTQLAAVATSLDRRWAGSTARVHYIGEYYRAADTAFAQALRERGLSVAQIGSHAGTADTSLTLALDPALVRTDRLAAAPSPGDGSAGDARSSSAALGQIGIEMIVVRSVAAIRRAVGR